MNYTLYTHAKATTPAKCSKATNIQTLANLELSDYLEAQANVLAPELSPIVPKVIKVEKVGLTRNSSSTPYLVYRVGDRRCCTFFKRKLLWHLVQTLLRIDYGIDEKIRSIVSTQFFDLSLKLGDSWLNVVRSHVCQFVERCNNRTQGAVIVPSNPLKDSKIGTSAKNCQVETPQCNQQQLFYPFSESAKPLYKIRMVLTSLSGSTGFGMCCSNPAAIASLRSYSPAQAVRAIAGICLACSESKERTCCISI